MEFRNPTSAAAGESTTAVLLSTLLFLICLSTFIFSHLRRQFQNNNNHTEKQSRLPPGSRGWPVIGDSFSWYNAVLGSHPPEFVERQVARFGSKVFSCRLFGGYWAVVSADPGFNRFVMQSEGRLFKSSYPKPFRDLVGKNGVVTAQGEQQRKLHGIASGLMKVERFNRTGFIEEIQSVMIRTLGVCSGEGDRVICLQDLCRKVAINLMVNQLLGASSDMEVDEMAQLFSDFVDGCLSVPVTLPGFAYHTAVKAREKITSKINKVAAKTRGEETSGEEDTCGASKGLLGRVLKEGSIDDDAVSDFIINLLFAGNETTAKTMVFAVYFLTRCPKAMQQLLEEQDGLSRDRMLTWDDYKAMPFTQCVIDETLRLGGIAIWLFREAIEDVSYEDYVIPKGSLVVPFLSAVHLDDKLYDEARKFNPWRWTEPENQGKRNWRSSPYFTPFGAGARFCPGAELARLQIAMFLHYFVTTYKWTQVKEDRMSFFPSARLVNGFQIRLCRRKEKEELELDLQHT